MSRITASVTATAKGVNGRCRRKCPRRIGQTTHFWEQGADSTIVPFDSDFEERYFHPETLRIFGRFVAIRIANASRAEVLASMRMRAEWLAALENGDLLPTECQLRRLARAYFNETETYVDFKAVLLELEHEPWGVRAEKLRDELSIPAVAKAGAGKNDSFDSLLPISSFVSSEERLLVLAPLVLACSVLLGIYLSAGRPGASDELNLEVLLGIGAGLSGFLLFGVLLLRPKHPSWLGAAQLVRDATASAAWAQCKALRQFEDLVPILSAPAVPDVSNNRLRASPLDLEMQTWVHPVEIRHLPVHYRGTVLQQATRLDLMERFCWIFAWTIPVAAACSGLLILVGDPFAGPLAISAISLLVLARARHQIGVAAKDFAWLLAKAFGSDLQLEDLRSGSVTSTEAGGPAVSDSGNKPSKGSTGSGPALRSRSSSNLA